MQTDDLIGRGSADDRRSHLNGGPGMNPEEGFLFEEFEPLRFDESAEQAG
jgi:hypothetical protein